MPERITIGGWSFDSPCCWLEDISGAWAAPTIVGGDRPQPEGDGSAVRPRRRGPILFTLGPGLMIGEVDPAGDPHPTYRQGLVDNWQAMLDAILPSAAEPDTKTMVHELVGGDSRVAEVHVVAVEGPAAVDGDQSFRFGLTVKVPAGVFDHESGES